MENLENLKKILIAPDGNGLHDYSMLPSIVMDNIKECLQDVIKNNIEGDFIETGVWKGGACIFAHHVIKSLGSDKKVYVADSFEGLPKPNTDKCPVDSGDDHWTYDHLKVSLEQVKSNFEHFAPLDDSVVFIKGWFKDTMFPPPVEKLSVLRLDGDMYESTIDVLESLYPNLSVGGYCIIDDWGLYRCRKAVEDYRKKYNIFDDIIVINPNFSVPCAYWKKTK
jgi:O-methyltransferase